MEFQKLLALQVLENDILADKEVEYVCGADVSYVNDTANCSAVIMERHTYRTIEIANLSIRTTHPYIPGLLMLREGKPLLATLKSLKEEFDILLIDGHGILHPRRCGLACYVGLVLDKPTIGVGKRLVCGYLREDQFIEDHGQVLGFKMSNQKNNKKSVYVSVGNLISLGSSIRLVEELTKEGYWIPEPLRLAHINSKNSLNFQSTLRSREECYSHGY
jgi:deoxyribonuclease V